MSELVKKDDKPMTSQAIAPAQDISLSPVEQLQMMKSAGFTPDDMRDMLALQKEYEANEARNHFKNLGLPASEYSLMVRSNFPNLV